MANPSQREPLTPEQLEKRRAQRHESRASSTYKGFLKDVCRLGSLDEEVAERAASSVLGLLEHRIVRQEAEDLEAQLPRKLRELLHRRERHEGTPPRKIGREEFLGLVGSDLGRQASEVEPTVRAVFEALAEHVDGNEIVQVVHQLPRDLRALWPEAICQRVDQIHGRQAGQRPAATRGEKEGPSAGSSRLGPRAEIVEVEERIMAMPRGAQLGLLRALAPRVLAAMAEEEREGFVRDLMGEIEHVRRGEMPTYGLQPPSAPTLH